MEKVKEKAKILTEALRKENGLKTSHKWTVEEKAKILTEALPYIKNYHNKVVVIKIGGYARIPLKLKHTIMRDIVLLKHTGMYPVIVHGGGPDITAEMKKRNMEPRFINGLRVTDDGTLNLITKVYTRINSEINRIIEREGGTPMGLFGDENELILARKKSEKLGFVGIVAGINKRLLRAILHDGFIPVVSPIGVGEDGKMYNVNADTAATALAVEMGAEKLTMLTHVDGIMDRGKRISKLTIEEAREKIKSGVISAGMIPKTEACMHAVKNGCGKAHLINGNVEHALLLEIFTNRGVGTEIVK